MTTYADYSNQNLTEMPDLSNLTNITSLNLSNNLLREIVFPENIIETLNILNLQNNRITGMSIPKNVIELNIDDNPLITIDEIPDSLTNLSATFISTNTINKLPKSVLLLCNKSTMNLEVNFGHSSIHVKIYPL
jgi:Leucine-rich repeat (LRR) protein